MEAPCLSMHELMNEGGGDGPDSDHPGFNGGEDPLGNIAVLHPPQQAFDGVAADGFDTDVNLSRLGH